MQIDLETYRDLRDRGALVHEWGDPKEEACLMSALAGARNIDGCVAAGWPKWLAELYVALFDGVPRDRAAEIGERLAVAAQAAEARGGDWDRHFRDIRLGSILPIALRSVGDGGEPWRVASRDVVQWSMDHDGESAPFPEEAARAAWAEEAAGAAWAAGAASAAWAAGAAEAAWAAWAARAAGAARTAWAAEAAWAAATAEAAWAAETAEAARTAACLVIAECTIAVLIGDADAT